MLRKSTVGKSAFDIINEEYNKGEMKDGPKPYISKYQELE